MLVQTKTPGVYSIKLVTSEEIVAQTGFENDHIKIKKPIKFEMVQTQQGVGQAPFPWMNTVSETTEIKIPNDKIVVIEPSSKEVKDAYTQMTSNITPASSLDGLPDLSKFGVK